MAEDAVHDMGRPDAANIALCTPKCFDVSGVFTENEGLEGAGC